MRLNGWERIGVVLTLGWLTGGFLWVDSTVIDAMGANVRGEYQHCLDTRSLQPDGSVPKNTDWGPCIHRFDADWPPAVAGHWVYAVIYTLLPIPVVWGLLYALVALGRWIVLGFRSPPPL